MRTPLTAREVTATMMISLNCPHCSSLVRAPESATGRTGKCPKCRNPVEIHERRRPAIEDYADMFATIEEEPETPDEPEEPPPSDSWEMPPSEPEEPFLPPPPMIPPRRPPAAVAVAVNGSATRPRSRSKHGPVGDFLDFRTMIATYVVRIIWMLGAAGITVALLVLFVTHGLNALEESFEHGLRDILMGLAFLVGILVAFLTAQLLWRLVCESLVIFFRIHEALQELVGVERTR